MVRPAGSPKKKVVAKKVASKGHTKAEAAKKKVVHRVAPRGSK
jgi:hypothetical protein